MPSLFRIVAPYFVCGVVVTNEKITRTAPIVKYMLGWSVEKMHQYAKQKRWTVQSFT